MSHLLKISPQLCPETMVYRTLDFFSAAAIQTNSTLMFSRADTFDDKNEGIDRLLSQLEVTSPNSGCGMGWSDAKTARKAHDSVKRSHYISCWSQTAESVAMWSLYSPDQCAVRISTTISKLQPAVEALISKYSLARITKADFGTNVVVATGGRIEPVTYASLADISYRVSRRAKARVRLSERYARYGSDVPVMSNYGQRYWERENQRRFHELTTTCQLKDTSFSHEAEVRLDVCLGEGVCTESTFEDQALLNPSHEHHNALRERLRFWSDIYTACTPDREFVSCPSALIETVAIDPRCPPHKAAFMSSWFLERGVRMVDSTCFGYLPNSFSVFPDC